STSLALSASSIRTPKMAPVEPVMPMMRRRIQKSPARAVYTSKRIPASHSLNEVKAETVARMGAAKCGEASPDIASLIRATNSGSSPRAGERMDPAGHTRARVLDISFGEEVLRLHSIDRIDRPQKVAFVAERHGGIDAHAALEHGVGGGPLLVAG